jgi:exodeoxyribonuclease-3
VPQAGTLKNQAKSLEVRLEPDDAKASRPVLRGGAGSNPQTLPDNGEAVSSEKYSYKLSWLKVLREYLKTLLDKNPDLCICGDFNVALEDRDIYNPVACANQVMASEAERLALRAVLELGLADAFRKFTAEGGHFSWWDYRAVAFRRNMGWRIDHVYLTPGLYERCGGCAIDKAPRKLEKPSDHAPVIVEF